MTSSTSYQEPDVHSSITSSDTTELIPPENFSMVEPSIYRSGFPSKKNFSFLRTLNLRTIIYLCPEDYPEGNLNFLNSCHVQLLQYGVAGNKEPFLEIPHDIFSLALIDILDTRNHPLLIHCNKGKHRTGCMIGVLHRVLGWSLSSIFEEYRSFSKPKERFMDQQFIECWQMTLPPDHPLLQPQSQQSSQQMLLRNNSNDIDSNDDDSNSIRSSPPTIDGATTPDLSRASSASSTAAPPTSSASSDPPLPSGSPVSHNPFCVNPEANEQWAKKEKEKEAKTIQQQQSNLTTKPEPASMTSNASLSQPHSTTALDKLLPLASLPAVSAPTSVTTTPLAVPSLDLHPRPLSRSHHGHTQSQPNLGALYAQSQQRQ